MDNPKTITIFDIDYTLFDTAHFKQSALSEYEIYKEVLGVLEDLSGFTMLGIFSKGKFELQSNKLEKTGIAKFFKKENVYIFDNKDENLIKIIDKHKGFKIFLVDDKLDVLYSAKKYMKQVFVIWVKRGWYAENQKTIPDFTPDAEVENLSEVVRIVRSNM